MKKHMFILICVCCIAFFLAVASAETYTVNVNIHFLPNLIFSTYDVDLYLNDQSLGTMPHGEDYSGSIEATEGRNTLYFYESGDKAVKGVINFDLKNDTNIKCTIKCHDEHITVNDLSIKEIISANSEDLTSSSFVKDEFSKGRELSIAEGEIVFRGIPWGSSINDVKNSVGEGKKLLSKLSEDASLSRIVGLNDLVKYFPAIKNKWYIAGTNAIIFRPEIQVAGYDLDDNGLLVYFAYLPNEDGIIKSDCDTALYAALYEIKVPNEEYSRTVGDLMLKLTGIYGSNYDSNTKTKNGEYNHKYYIWKGTNDSYVVLCDKTEYGFFGSTTRKVQIVYASRAYERYLEEAGAILSRAEEATSTTAPFDNNSRDGL